MKIRISDILISISSGTLTAFSFPKFNLSFFSWISLIPIILIISKKNPKQSFLLGLISGFSFYAVLLYWIPDVPIHYGNLSLAFSILIYILLILFLALFWAFFSLTYSKIHQSFPKFVLFLAPFIWVSFEYILTHIFTGFPWGLIGYSQYKNIYLIQTASITGVYGISFILLLFQSSFIFSVNFKKKAPFFSVLTLVLIIHLWGYAIIKPIHSTDNSLKASVIQGNVPSETNWNEESPQEIYDLFDQHLELSFQAYLQGCRLIVWPELSVPLCFSCHYGIYEEFKDKLFQFVQKTECTFLLGTYESTKTKKGIQYYNTALCLSPNLSTSQYYKMHLVPFGEYTPYKKIFSFISKFTHAIGELTPGEKYSLHEFEGIKFGSPICYEIIFPNLVRRFVKIGGNFLVTITNDGWYGKSSAPYQHFSIAVFRAVENRRFLLRAATTGISGIVDPYGRILSQSKLDTKTFLLGNITPSQALTLYTKHGDVLPLASLTLSILFLILTILKRKNERKKSYQQRKIF